MKLIGRTHLESFNFLQRESRSGLISSKESNDQIFTHRNEVIVNIHVGAELCCRRQWSSFGELAICSGH